MKLRLLLFALSVYLGIFYKAHGQVHVHDSSGGPYKAVALMGNGNVGVSGVITFVQANCNSATVVDVKLQGLAPGLRGLHVHTTGDLSGGCDTLLTHYNPLNKTHGDITNPNRHVGDLGNVLADSQGNVNTLITDKIMSLCGDYSVIGRGIIIHNGTDDLGLTGVGESLTTGNSGGRAACGVIGIG